MILSYIVEISNENVNHLQSSLFFAFSVAPNTFCFFRSICIKELLTPIIPVLKDLEKGLQYFCLLCQVKKHPGLFKLFTCSSQYKVTVGNFLDKLTVVYGEQQFPKNLEDDIFRYFIDSILGLYHEGM